MNPVPVNVVTGALGVGKTSAIAKLLANKPIDEYWVVILNEFTDAGIDAITLATSARGAYDVRVVSGGCLCCTGELDFRRTLKELFAERRPDRLIIEPSGIGHPGAMLEELRRQERGGAVALMSTIGLVDPKRLHYFSAEGVERDQIEVADVLLLAKTDIASSEERVEFDRAARQCFPPKRFIGEIDSLLREVVLAPPPPTYSFLPMSPAAPATHITAQTRTSERTVQFGSMTSTAHTYALLDREACGWTLPREAVFNRVELFESLQKGAGLLSSVERLKAVLRTGIEHWTLFNVSVSGVTMTPCGWRQDSRIEVQLHPHQSPDWSAWDAYWQAMIS
jgi:G3E family GTPase